MSGTRSARRPGAWFRLPGDASLCLRGAGQPLLARRVGAGLRTCIGWSFGCTLRSPLALGGLFRQYELIYVAADERDVIRLRTNYRRNPPEEVYVYRTRASNGIGRRLFVEYMEHMNSLRTRPEFYNTLTTNCTTATWMLTPQAVSMRRRIACRFADALNAAARLNKTRFEFKIRSPCRA